MCSRFHVPCASRAGWGKRQQGCAQSKVLPHGLESRGLLGLRQASCRFLEAGFLPGHSLQVAQCRTDIALAELFGVITLSRTMRQQGWLGKAAAGLRAVQGAAARAGAAGLLPLIDRH